MKQYVRIVRNCMTLAFFLAVSNVLLADFVDIATITVNGKLFRKLINNQSEPYSVSFGNHVAGDTVNLHIRTDNGSEQHAFFVLTDTETGVADTMEGYKTRFLLKKAHLTHAHNLTVYFRDFYGEKIAARWEICHVVPDVRIEKAYAATDALIAALIALKPGQRPISSEVIKNPVFIHFAASVVNGETVRKPVDSVRCEPANLQQALKLSKDEILFLKAQKAINYVTMYDEQHHVFGDVITDGDVPDTVTLRMQNRQHILLFKLKYDETSRSFYLADARIQPF